MRTTGPTGPAQPADPADDPFAVARGAAEVLAQRSGVERHDVAMILGSGWQGAIDGLGTPVAEVAMADLPGFPAPSVVGHAGVVRSLRCRAEPSAGRGAGAQGAQVARVAAFLGRVHRYEGYPVATVVHAVRTAVFAGCRVVVLTNAAGAVNPAFTPGQAVLIADHINLSGASPLTGPLPAPPYDLRFVDMTDAYSPRLRQAARQVDPTLAEGVYAALPGPQFETPAEIRMVRALGGDLVGMSTVLETIAARHLGAEVLGCSIVTNMAAGISADPIDHADVLRVARDSAARMGTLLGELIARL